MKRFLSQAELTARTNRSEKYIQAARVLGLIEPAGITLAGTFLYEESAVNAVRAIQQPVLSRKHVQPRPA